MASNWDTIIRSMIVLSKSNHKINRGIKGEDTSQVILGFSLVTASVSRHEWKEWNSLLTFLSFEGEPHSHQSSLVDDDVSQTLTVTTGVTKASVFQLKHSLEKKSTTKEWNTDRIKQRKQPKPERSEGQPVSKSVWGSRRSCLLVLFSSRFFLLVDLRETALFTSTQTLDAYKFLVYLSSDSRVTLLT